MTNTVWEWVVGRVLDRIGTLMAGSLATTAEARLIRSHMETLRELETLADQYEAEGKGHLAQTVRQQAARLTPASSGESARSVLKNLSQDDQTSSELLGLPVSHQPVPNPVGPSLLSSPPGKLPAPKSKTGRQRNRSRKPQSPAK